MRMGVRESHKQESRKQESRMSALLLFALSVLHGVGWTGMKSLHFPFDPSPHTWRATHRRPKTTRSVEPQLPEPPHTWLVTAV